MLKGSIEAKEWAPFSWGTYPNKLVEESICCSVNLEDDNDNQWTLVIDSTASTVKFSILTWSDVPTFAQYIFLFDSGSWGAEDGITDLALADHLDASTSEATGGFELAVAEADGKGSKILGSRDFARYYKQNHKPETRGRSTRLATLQQRYSSHWTFLPFDAASGRQIIYDLKNTSEHEPSSCMI